MQIGDIKQLTLGHRNRLKQRFLDHKESLLDYEILELLLFYAVPRKDVKPLAKYLVNYFGGLKKVLHAPISELNKISGLSKHIIILLKMSVYLSQKTLEYDIKEKPVAKNWNQILDYCFLKLANSTHEQIYAVYLNTKNFIIKEEIVAEGSINYAITDLRMIMHKCLNLGAAAILLAHNHPSGEIEPSKEDIKITNDLFKIAKALNIYLYDHLIVGKKGVYSFRENGLIKEN